MKLLIVVVQDYDVGRLLSALSEAEIGATRIASAGGFLRAGNTTVLIGVEDERLGIAKLLFEQTCRRRAATPASGMELIGMEAYEVSESRIRGGVAFVASVERFERMTAAPLTGPKRR